MVDKDVSTSPTKSATTFAAVTGKPGAPLDRLGEQLCLAVDKLVRDGYIIKGVVPQLVPYTQEGCPGIASVTSGFLVLAVHRDAEGGASGSQQSSLGLPSGLVVTV